jgi:hypothetical protein
MDRHLRHFGGIEVLAMLWLPKALELELEIHNCDAPPEGLSYSFTRACSTVR